MINRKDMGFNISTKLFSTSLLTTFVLLFLSVTTSGYEITILHTNDVHARFEQFNKYGSQCNEEDVRDGECFGGVARRQTKIQEIRESHDNVLLVDAGDQFMGTNWFTVYRGMAASYFMKQLGYDVMVRYYMSFILLSRKSRVRYWRGGARQLLDNVTFPVVSANTDVTNEPRLQRKFLKSWTTTIGGEQIGIVGYLTPDTAQISNGGPTVTFTDILPAVRDEVAVLQDRGINKIIAVGHAGFNTDKQVAAIDGIDIAVGGHTNTFLYNGEQPAGEDIEGTYPVVVDQAGGGKGLVVQAYTMGKYLGYLKLTFDSNGVIRNFSGNPILLDATVVEDAQIKQYVSEWQKPVDDLGAQIVGYSKVVLDGERKSCRLKECNLGNLVTDAIIDYHINYSHPESDWAPAAIALWNGGGIRSSIDKGNVSAGEVISVLPFGNEVDLVTVSGKNLREQLEKSVANYDRTEPSGAFLQMAGLRVVYNLQNPAQQRVVSAEAICLQCDIPKYEPLDDNKNYNIFVSTFVINGGDGYEFKPSRRQRFNTLDVTTLTDYFKKHSPLYPGVEGRIRFHTDTITSAGPELISTVFLMFLAFLLSLL